MQNLALRLARLGALFTAVVALAPSLACAERKKEPRAEAPPPVQPLAVKVRRGEPCDIMLRIYGQKNEQLTYLIRTPPQHGRLTEPLVVGREVSAVTYTPAADLAVLHDRFTYAVQSRAGVSAAVDVLITIVDLPPRLALPDTLGFSPLLPGTTSAQALVISNTGGGLAEGRAAVDLPWKIDGPATYRLGAGERATFQVIFAPEVAGSFESAVRFTSQPETSVPLHGVARAALTASATKIVLQHSPGDPVRTGSFELTNQTDAEIRVILPDAGRLRVPPELAVPAHGTVRVPVQMAGSDVAALEGEVRLDAPGFALRVPVQAPPVGAILRAGCGLIVFGLVDATRIARASLELENIGGTKAAVNLEIAAPFATEQSALTLSPGEKKTIELRTQPGAAGKYRALLTVNAGRQRLEIPCEAELVATSAPALPAAVAVPNVVPVGDSSAESTTPVPAPVAPDNVLANLRLAKGVKLTAVTATGALLEWPVAMSGATQFRLERRTLVLDETGELKYGWNELPGVIFRREGDRHVAVLRGLEPESLYGLRVMPIGSDREPGPPLFSQNFTTRAKPGLWLKITPLRILLAVLALCVALVFRQRSMARRSS